jgi:glycosyltransferase involved in cell wall biosynthesis
VKSKRPLDAVTAFSVLQRVLPEARMYVIGDGPLRPEIERLRIPSLTVTGRLSAKMRDEILASSDLLLATSVREGWGMNVTEAAEFGVFTIGYDVPGLRDSISESGGVLADQDPHRLAAEMLNYFSVTPRRKPKRLNRSWAEVATDFERYFEFCLSEKI